MKILIVTHSYPPSFKGGGEISVELLARTLKKNGIDVTVLSFDGDKEEKINNITIMRKSFHDKKGVYGKLRMMFYIKKISKEYDIIHAYNMFFYEYLGILSLFFGIKIIGSLNNLPDISLGTTKNPFKKLKRQLFNKIRLKSISNFEISYRYVRSLAK